MPKTARPRHSGPRLHRARPGQQTDEPQLDDLTTKIVELARGLLAETRHYGSDVKLTGFALAASLNPWAPQIAIAAHEDLCEEAVAQLERMGYIDTQVTELIDLLHEFLELSGYDFQHEWRPTAASQPHAVEVAHA
jgi:hypothetical protein